LGLHNGGKKSFGVNTYLGGFKSSFSLFKGVFFPIFFWGLAPGCGVQKVLGHLGPIGALGLGGFQIFWGFLLYLGGVRGFNKCVLFILIWGKKGGGVPQLKDRYMAVRSNIEGRSA